MHRATFVIVALITLSRTSHAQYGEWKKIYEVKPSDGWLGAVWAESETRWAAGGKDLLIDTLNDGHVRLTELTNLAVMDIAQTRGGLIAVGSRGGIWSITPQRIRKESGAESSVQYRGRDRDLIMRLGDAVIGGTNRTVTLGVDSHKVFEEQSQAWVTVREGPLLKQLNDEVLSAHSLAAPTNCGPRTWLPFNGTLQKGTLLCGRKHLLKIDQRKATELPDLPTSCGLPGSAAEIAEGRVALLCEGKTNLIMLAGGKWVALQTPQKFRFISATKSCLFGTVSSSVWRACMAEEPAVSPASTKEPASASIDVLPQSPPPKAPTARRPGGCAFSL